MVSVSANRLLVVAIAIVYLTVTSAFSTAGFSFVGRAKILGSSSPAFPLCERTRRGEVRRGARWTASSSTTLAKRGKSDLSSGVSMEFFSLPASSPTRKAPIIFIHGSFHGGWCWAEYWMSYFSQQRGFDTYAVSLRGTSGTPLPVEAAAAGIKAVQMAEHVADLGAFIDSVLPAGSPPPVLVGHSFGGMYVQKFLEANARPLSAAVMMCSVPPSGNSAIVSRFIRNKPLLALDIVRGLVFKQAGTNPRIARRLFFPEASPSDEQLLEYMQNFKKDGVIALDVRKAVNEFPALTASGPDGKAAFLHRAPPLMVMGADEDQIVDRLGVEETADFYGVDAVWVKHAHDLMLGEPWEGPAKMLGDWLDAL